MFLKPRIPHELGALLVLLAGALPPQAARAQALSASADAAPQRALVNRYCATCHNERLKTAGLLLDKANVETPALDGTLWETVLRKLRGNSMPPANAPR